MKWIELYKEVEKVGVKESLNIDFKAAYSLQKIENIKQKHKRKKKTVAQKGHLFFLYR
jgi:hypothetical protein